MVERRLTVPCTCPVKPYPCVHCGGLRCRCLGVARVYQHYTPDGAPIAQLDNDSRSDQELAVDRKAVAISRTMEAKRATV